MSLVGLGVRTVSFLRVKGKELPASFEIFLNAYPKFMLSHFMPTSQTSEYVLFFCVIGFSLIFALSRLNADTQRSDI
jgi:hypothetical protein